MRHIQVTNPNTHPVRGFVTHIVRDCRAILNYDRVEHVELHMRILLFLWDMRLPVSILLSIFGPAIGIHIAASER